MKRSGQIDREPDAGFHIGSGWSRGRGGRWRRGLGGWRCRGIPPHESGGIGGQQGLTGGHGSGVQQLSKQPAVFAGRFERGAGAGLEHG